MERDHEMRGSDWDEPTPYTYIQRYYGVHPRVGEWVKHTVTGGYGVVCDPEIDGGGHYVRVRFCGRDFASNCHPKELIYSGSIPTDPA